MGVRLAAARFMARRQMSKPDKEAAEQLILKAYDAQALPAARQAIQDLTDADIHDLVSVATVTDPIAITAAAVRARWRCYLTV